MPSFHVAFFIIVEMIGLAKVDMHFSYDKYIVFIFASDQKPLFSPTLTFCYDDAA